MRALACERMTLMGADWIVFGHSHFDHLWGAERIARRTGATIIGSHETVRLMEQEGVPLAQLLPVGGGERIRLSPQVTVAVYPNRDRPSGGSVVHERAAGDVYGGGSHGASLI